MLAAIVVRLNLLDNAPGLQPCALPIRCIGLLRQEHAILQPYLECSA